MTESCPSRQESARAFLRVRDRAAVNCRPIPVPFQFFLRENCVTGITANRSRLECQVDSFVGVITALIPQLGYANAAKLAKEALAADANMRT